MSALMVEVTRRLPDRWLASTLGPGALWVTVAALAVRLGHSHAFSVAEVRADARALGTLVRDHPAEALAYGLLAVGAAVAVSSLARLVGGAVRALWLGRWRGPLAALGNGLTRRRADRARARLRTAQAWLPADYLPQTATWIGDRLLLADTRISAQYGLSLALVWPRLWQLVDEDTRALVQQARARIDLACTIAGWAACYAALTVFWWPAAIVAGVVFTAAWRRGRLAAAVFADAVEATVDLQHRTLAEELGHHLEPGKALPPSVADAINDQLHKGGTPQRRGEA
ncbi:hypothetical protein AB0L99_37100 [Streptomyces sp. NPDC051954]|uniref:hypothetical protein n=1 Tax=unclassified Streptomyces TaxID=2593676 RepID=UPI0034140E4B